MARQKHMHHSVYSRAPNRVRFAGNVYWLRAPVPNSKISTTVLLTHWEKGSTDAERLCADLLRTDGFDVDPQHPLGGPDGGKDILCTKDDNTFVAAAHFTRQAVSFSATKRKFKSDLAASLKHDRSGFIFLTNQKLAIGERSALEKLAASSGKRCLIYHRERLRVMLDTAAGYGIRLAHLGVLMSNEEQAAFFASSGQGVTEALKAQTRAIEKLSQRVTRMAREGLDFTAHSAAVVIEAVSDPARGRTDVAEMLKAAAATSFQRVAEDPADAVSAQLTPSLLRYIHRLLLPTDLAFAGKFRETQVWLVNARGQPNPNTECPAWDKIPILVDELLYEWNGNFSTLFGHHSAAIEATARFFQRLTWIHPFVDGNGRLARAILNLQVRELVGLTDDLILDRGAAFYQALLDADAGNFTALERAIERALEYAQ